MAVFAIYSRPSAHNASLAQQAEAVVVREGFSFWAMLMTPLWCLYHRAWRPLLGLILLGLVIEVLFGKTGLNNPALHSVMDGLIAVYIGFAAAELRGMALQRRGFDLVNVVVAEAEDQALLRHLEQGHVLSGSQTAVPAAVVPAVTPDLAHPSYRRAAIVGLFPEVRR